MLALLDFLDFRHITLPSFKPTNAVSKCILTNKISRVNQMNYMNCKSQQVNNKSRNMSAFARTHPSRFWSSQKLLKAMHTFLTLSAPMLLDTESKIPIKH